MVKMVPGTKLTILHCKCSLRSLLVILFFFVILLFSLACITPSLVSESLFVILFFFSVFARRSRGNLALSFLMEHWRQKNPSLSFRARSGISSFAFFLVFVLHWCLAPVQHNFACKAEIAASLTLLAMTKNRVITGKNYSRTFQ